MQDLKVSGVGLWLKILGVLRAKDFELWGLLVRDFGFRLGVQGKV